MIGGLWFRRGPLSLILVVGSLASAVDTAVAQPTSDPVDSGVVAALRTDSLSQGPSVSRLAFVGAATVGGFIYGHVLGQELWWKGERSNFHFEWDRDWRYALGADKLGHAWFPYIVGSGYRDILVWCRVDTSTAVWASAALALAYQSFIEVRDGFSAQWGFSFGDYAANVLGAALPVAQYHVPALRDIRLKLSFYPSDVWRAGAHRAIIDDYESTYHWLVLGLPRLLPQSVAKWYPEFVDVAVGHSVKNLDGRGGGDHELYVALDWNLDAIGGDWWPWNALRAILRYYHLPAPSLRIYPGPVRFGLLL